MLIAGIVKSISPNYPYTVTMQSGKVFTSHFKFTKGANIRLNLTGDVFDSPWPKGFWHCTPNGFTDHQLSPAQVEAAKNPESLYVEHNLPIQCRHAIRHGKQEWTNVESFYTYHYSAEFNHATNVLTTNYALR